MKIKKAKTALPNGAVSPQETQRRLLQAAKILFAKKGYDATSVKDLCIAASVNISLVSYHFGGKEGLYKACLESFGQERLGRTRAILTPPSTRGELKDRLTQFLTELITVHTEQAEMIQILNREMHSDRPATEAVFRETFMKSFQVMIEFIRSAQERELVAKDLDPSTSGGILFAIVMHVSKMEAVNKKYFNVSITDPTYRKHLIDHIIRMYFEGHVLRTAGEIRGEIT